jgi:tetratricopeptide (TPR) repeat protein
LTGTFLHETSVHKLSFQPERGQACRQDLQPAQRGPSNRRALAGFFAGLVVVTQATASPPHPLPQKAQTQQSSAETEYHVGKGYSQMQEQRYDQAAHEFERALGLDPKRVRARYQLAVCYFALGQREQSRRQFTRLLAETGNDSSIVYYLGRLDLDEGNLDSAIQRLRSITSEPPFPDTAYYLGSAYLKKHDLPAAQEWLKKAQKDSPRDFRIPDHFARVYQQAGRKEEAEKEYTLAAGLRQRYDDASQRAVSCSRALETLSLAQARASCQALFDPTDPDRLTTLGSLYGQHGDYAEAVEPLLLAVKLDPDSWEIQHNLGLTYFRLRRHAQARLPLERAVALRPDFFGSNALLGATLFALREDERAYRILEHAHQLNPDDAETADLLQRTALSLGQKFYTQREYSKSLNYLRTAAEIQPSNAEVHRHLADIYMLLGQRDRASEENREADRLMANEQ